MLSKGAIVGVSMALMGVFFVAKKMDLFKANPVKEQRSSSLKQVSALPLPVDKVLGTDVETDFAQSDRAYYLKLKGFFNTGDFLQAKVFFDELWQKRATLGDHFRQWMERQGPAIYASAGWLELNLGRCPQAIQVFFGASESFPSSESQKGLAVCLHKTQQFGEAESQLKSLIESGNKDPDISVLYSDVLESMGRYEEAVTVLESVQNSELLSDDEKASLQKLLTSMRLRAKEGAEQRTEYFGKFAISFRSGEHDNVVTRVNETLQSALAEFESLFERVLDPSKVIEVILYRSEVFGPSIPGVPSWSEGVFDGRIRVPVALNRWRQDPSSLDLVLRHELSHAMVYSIFDQRRLPSWFDEGLAQYLSCRHTSCAEFRFGPTPGDFASRELLEKSFGSLERIDAQRVYTQSHYLMMSSIHHRGEQVLGTLNEVLPSTGTLTSDVLARAFSFASFDEWRQSTEQKWIKKQIK